MNRLRLSLLLVLCLSGVRLHAQEQRIYSEVPFIVEGGVVKTTRVIVAFNRNVIPTDRGVSIVDTTAYPVRDPSVQAVIRQLGNRYGLVRIKKSMPRMVWGDTLVVNKRTGATSKVHDRSQEFAVDFKIPLPVDSVILILESLPSVRYAERPISVGPLTTPNDPEYGNQWYLGKIQMPSAWDISTGSASAKVAVIDLRGTYDETLHDDFKLQPSGSKIVGGDGQTGGHHSTGNLGIIGASTSNGTGIASVGWNVSLLSYHFDDHSPSETRIRLPELIDEAAASADVINFSFITLDMNGCPSSYSSVFDAIDAAVAAGVVLVAGAGNGYYAGCGSQGGSIPYTPYPASYYGVIGVSATDQNDRFVDTWNYGSFVDVAAPGLTIRTTDQFNGYQYTQGTSLSSPQVAALAGLIVSTNPTLSSSQIEAIIEGQADKVDQGRHPDVNGRNNYTGYGRVNAYKALVKVIDDLSAVGKSASSSATLGNSQRKLVRESSGTIHHVFESGNQVYYRKSTNDGAIWQAPIRISGTGVSTNPCITMAGAPIPAILVAWQHSNGSNYDLVVDRSTNGGTLWASTTLQSNFACSSPGPVPSLSGYPTGSAFISYRTSSALFFAKSTNSGSIWTTPAAISGTNGNYNNPSSAINTTYWSADQANIAYATDLPSGSPQIYCTYYEPVANTWGTVFNLTSIIPGEYTQHANPCLAVSSNSSYKTVHVAWDAWDINQRVIIHRKGSFRAFGSDYTVIHYQSQDKPSITGLDQDAAWMVFENSNGGGVWKCHYYYTGSVWAWGSQTYISSGFNPQISVGSTSAKYVSTEGTAAPYVMSIGSEILTKPSETMSLAWKYSRELNIIDPHGGSDVSFEVGTPQLIHFDKTVEYLSLIPRSDDSSHLGISDLLNAGSTVPFTLGTDADSLSLVVGFAGKRPTELFQDATGSIAFQLVDTKTGTVIGEFGKRLVSTIPADEKQFIQMTISVGSIASLAAGSLFIIRPTITGLNSMAHYTTSVGHVYRGMNTTGMKISEEMNTARAVLPVPTDFGLFQNFPNPFNPITEIRYALPRGGHVLLRVYNTLGEVVRLLVDGSQDAGYHTVSFDANSLPSGVCFYRLQAGAFVDTKKLILLR